MSVSAFAYQRSDASADSILDENHEIVVEIPSLSTHASSSTCVESSEGPSIAGILTPSPSSSLPPQLNVTFAPLPRPVPRKRRSVPPLGTATRRQLMRRSRHPTWTAEDLEEQRRRKGDGFEDVGVAVEEAISELGRMMKGAGKGLWKKVAGSDIRKGKQRDPGIMLREDKDDEKASEAVGEQRREVREAGGDQGSDGEGKDLLLSTVGETETIVEGSVTFSWMDDKSGAT